MAEETIIKPTRQVPIVAIRDTVVFPRTDVLLSFGRPRSVNAVASAFAEDRVIAIFAQKDAKSTDPDETGIFPVGTIATITQMMRTDGEIHALIRGQARITLTEVTAHDPFLAGKVVELTEENQESDRVKAIALQLADLFKRAINNGKQVEVMTVMKLVSGQVEPVELADQLASILDVKATEKQKLLEELSLEKRLEKILELLASEVNVLELERSIAAETQKRFEGQMRKAMLRERKHAIEQELGEKDDEFGSASSEEIRDYKKKIKAAGMPKEVLAKAEKELKKLSQMSPYNPEGGYLRNYLDWLVEMPWDKVTPNNVSIKNAAKILADRHYGMEKAKERILEFLAVMKIKGAKSSPAKRDESQPTILCFIGPPGVGKTSIGRSIAEALNRKFVRISLGGIRDEAEIRGHRRTYVGALPGRVIQGIKNADSKNPVFMLDEIDKVGNDFRGDPSAALLEALDPEQNREFSDHYLEVPFDLSQVMFIATGNILDTVPAALRDRMEIISFPGYTEEEKFAIAARFLWPKELKLHGISDKGVKLANPALKEIIARYTREAGVRNLERNLAAVCRKIARLIAESKKFPTEVGVSDIHKFLGPQKFSSQIAEKQDEAGMATGLAVTGAGGEILFIEVALMPGKGHLTLTGQLGDVMKESARAAFTWAKSHYQDLGLKRNFALGIDVHIHVPEGAVPKDGPSAGVAMTTALVSALTGISVRREVGMTGEVTLRGRVLEIGGVKEKVIAGHTAGLTTIILPKDNKKDLEEVPESIKKNVKFHFVTKVDEVLEIALNSWPPKRAVDSANYTPMSMFLAANPPSTRGVD